MAAPPQMAVILVDTAASINLCLADISPTVGPKPTKLAIDIEGVNLCRHGRISIIQIVAETSKTIWLLDVTTLGATVFDHENSHGQSLRGVLQSPDTRKLFFDVRNDADALWNAYKIDLANVYDLQVLEVANRRSRSITVGCINGLKRCIEQYVGPPTEWKKVKEEGNVLFSPEKGGSYDIFEKRPLDPRILAYCAQDIALLFQLETAMRRTMGAVGRNWEDRIIQCSARRAAEAKSSSYDGPTGRHRAIAPMF